MQAMPELYGKPKKPVAKAVNAWAMLYQWGGDPIICGVGKAAHGRFVMIVGKEGVIPVLITPLGKGRGGK